jgi:cytochrome c oxidase accessory protein FixG
MSLFSNTRKWVYPKSIQGKYSRLRHVGAVFLHLALVVIPWVQIYGHPAVQFDLPARRVYLLGSVFTAADGLIIAVLGFIAAFSLFFWTALFGRVWCGYLCPQTVMLDTWVRTVERWIEGDRRSRMALDARPWDADKVARKTAKWVFLAAVSFAISMSFTAWFTGPVPLWTGQAGTGAYGIVGFFTFFWFADLAWFREQFCNYVCPYARFQGALADDHSMVVSYIPARGEPRGHGKEVAQAGRCIDCHKCVVVCPAGIDIRDGYQLECITCSLCVDACTDVMGKLGHESLVQHTTEGQLKGLAVKWARPRTAVYFVLLVGLTVVVGNLMWKHVPFEAYARHAPGPLYVLDDAGMVRNTFLMQLANNDIKQAERHFEVTVRGVDGAKLTVQPIELAADGRATVPVIVEVPAADAPHSAPLLFDVMSGDHVVTLETSFNGPQ